MWKRRLESQIKGLRRDLSKVERVPNRFFGIRDLAYFKAGIRDFGGKGGTRFGIEIMTGTRDLAILTGGNREMSL